MNDYPLTIDEICTWFRSKELVSNSRGVILAGIHEGRSTDKPAAFADFDTEFGIGRITVWVSGEVDFEVLRRSDGKHIRMFHEQVSTLADSALDQAVDGFMDGMT